MALNFTDILLCLVILLSAVWGWQRGFLRGMLDVIRWFGSLILALRFYPTVAHWLESYFSLPAFLNAPVAFLFIVTVASVGIQILGLIVLRGLGKEVHENALNRALGVVPGLISGIVTAAILAPVLLALPLPDSLRNSTRESQIANRLAVVTQRLETALSPVFDDAVRQTLNLLTVRPEPESNETVKLPYKVTDVTPRPDLEAQMLVLVNQERANAGLKPLVMDPELTQVARQHSADMFARGYFSHYTPEGLSPFDRMHKAGVNFRTAGENLALAPTLTIAHNGLMNSPGHRANILRPQFGRVGIGILDGGARGLMISQEFRD
jgi:uncharacterized protein YkwD